MSTEQTTIAAQEARIVELEQRLAAVRDRLAALRAELIERRAESSPNYGSGILWASSRLDAAIADLFGKKGSNDPI